MHQEPKWMLKVVDLLASSQSSGHIIWKHYGSLWRTNKMLDIKCLVLTMYWKPMVVFWRNECAIISPTLFCVHVFFSFLFPGGVLSAAEYLEMHHALFFFLFLPVCFEVIASNVTDNESMKLFFILHSAAHMNSKPDQILPSLLSTKLISTQLNGDIVCRVRWQSGL